MRFSGVHLRDLVLSHTALPDKLNDDLINFRKMAQMSHVFRDLLSLQSATCPVHSNMDIVNTIRVSAPVVVDVTSHAIHDVIVSLVAVSGSSLY